MDAVFMLYKSFDGGALWQKKRPHSLRVAVDIRPVQISLVMVADPPIGKTGMRFFRVRNWRQSSPYFSIHDCGSVPKLSSQSLNRRSDQSRPFTSFR